MPQASTSKIRFDTNPQRRMVSQWSFSTTPALLYTAGSSSLSTWSATTRSGSTRSRQPLPVDRRAEPAGQRVRHHRSQDVPRLGHDGHRVPVLRGRRAPGRNRSGSVAWRSTSTGVDVRLAEVVGEALGGHQHEVGGVALGQVERLRMADHPQHVALARRAAHGREAVQHQVDVARRRGGRIGRIERLHAARAGRGAERRAPAPRPRASRPSGGRAGARERRW